MDSQNGLKVGMVGQSEWLEGQNGWKVGMAGKLEWLESQKVGKVGKSESGNGWYGQIVG